MLTAVVDPDDGATVHQGSIDESLDHLTWGSFQNSSTDDTFDAF